MKATVLVFLDFHPTRFKLAPALARALQMRSASESGLNTALWAYIRVMLCFACLSSFFPLCACVCVCVGGWIFYSLVLLLVMYCVLCWLTGWVRLSL